MVNYNCLRCGYETNIKTILVRHLSRKIPCKAIYEDIPTEHLKQKLLDNEYKKECENYAKTAENHAKTNEKYTKNGENHAKTAENHAKTNEKYAKNGENHAKTAENHAKTNEKYTEYSESDLSESFQDSDSIDTEEGMLICKECDVKFNSKEELELHLKKKCKMLLKFNNIYNFDGKTLGKNIFKNKKEAGEIYIIQTDYMTEDIYKIGITRHISKRICQYRSANSYEPRLHYYFPCQDVKAIDKDLNKGLIKFHVKREIFQGDIEEIKDCIKNIIMKKFNLKETKVIEPEIKLGDIRECIYCNKCFYESKDLFKHFNLCSNYRESLNKKAVNVCEFCNKEFSSRQGKWRHLKSCKEKAKDDDQKANLLHLVDMLNLQLNEQKEQKEQLKRRDEQLNEELKRRDKQIEEQNKQINELIKKAGITQNIQNIQNNFKVLAYKNTDLSHLTDQDYIQCLNRSNMVIPNLIKKIHFNPKKPENHNIYISNIKNKYVMIYDGTKWDLCSRDETIDDLIDTNEMVIEQKLEEWLENGKEYPEIMKKFNRYLEKKEKDEVINKIKEEIRLILFNNRNVIDKDSKKAIDI